MTIGGCIMKTKKILSAVLALLLVFSLAACGSKVRADEKLNGKYTAVVGEMMGMSPMERIVFRDDADDLHGKPPKKSCFFHSLG